MSHNVFSRTNSPGQRSIRPCAPLHLVLEVERFRTRLALLASTVPTQDFAWFRAAINDAFDRVLCFDTEGHQSKGDL